jgi:hypothetical protein
LVSEHLYIKREGEKRRARKNIFANMYQQVHCTVPLNESVLTARNTFVLISKNQRFILKIKT